MSAEFELSGRAAPPMANGEVAFEAPWQGRVFGMATGLVEGGLFTWDEFRVSLIDRIAAWERTAAPPATYPYYDCFLAALEGLLIARGLLTAAAIGARDHAIGTRRDDHDHDHDDEHDHLHHHAHH